MKSITVREVKSTNDENIFLKLPWKIYKSDPFWIPPLLFDLKRQLNKKTNPFFKDADVRFWLACRNEESVGRIAAIINHQHNNYYNQKTGFFGYFECVNDTEVAKALFDTAYKWLQGNGMETILGPVNLSLNNECGLLIEGFDRSPILQMSYNHTYYIKLLGDYGFEKEHDLYAFYISDDIIGDDRIMKRLKRITDLVIQKEGIVFRQFDTRNFKSEVEKIRVLFNDYMSDNWGFFAAIKSRI